MQLKHLTAVAVTPETLASLEILFDNNSLSHDIDSGSTFVFYDKVNDEFYGTTEEPNTIPYDEFVARVTETFMPSPINQHLEEFEEYLDQLDPNDDLGTLKAGILAQAQNIKYYI